MKKILSAVAFLIIIPIGVKSQVFPKENSKLNYRYVGFSFPSKQHFTTYTLEVAEGNYNDEGDFKKKIVLTQHSNSTQLVAEVPSFNTAYTWHVVYTNTNKDSSSDLYHFSTMPIPKPEGDSTRLKVIENDKRNNEFFIFLDATQALYDADGNVVWFLPNIERDNKNDLSLRDLKMSQQGTITFLFGNKQDQSAYEINYNGTVLWKAPNNGKISGDSAEHYHHEFTRLANGHYMVLGSELLDARLPSTWDSNIVVFYAGRNNKSANTKLPFGTLIEYDENGKIIWSWKSSSYFKGSDLQYRKKQRVQLNLDVHDNAFFFDEKKKKIYLSFRNISRIIEIQYPGGNVSNTYGELFKPNIPKTENGLFCGQHSCKVSKNGNLYLFNNNICDPNALPKIVIMKIPRLEKAWEYACTVESNDTNIEPRKFEKYGNVVELPNSMLFVSMSSETYSKVFTVDMDKKIHWSALPQKWDAVEKAWVSIPLYRASIINSRTELERMIWNKEK